jgi:putative peptidoglycan lipid II flippase
VSNKLNTRASGIVAIAVMCSRVLGLVREVLFSALFGSERLGAFIVAFRIPNLLRDLFAEGALSTAFITVFSRKLETEGEQSAWALASKMFTLAIVFMSAVTILGVLLAEPLFNLISWGAPPSVLAWKDLVVLLTQVMFPFILLVSLAALVMGMLNARNVFGVPAMASSFFNIGSIVGGVLLAWWLEPDFVETIIRLRGSDAPLPGQPFGQRALLGLAIGTLLGGLLQFAVQLPSLRKVGFSFRPDFLWRDAGVKKILELMVPSVIAASAVQVNVLINTSFAMQVGMAAPAWLNNAFRLMQLPLGIFGVAVATITLPVVSRIAVSQDRQAFGPTLGRALRLAVFFTIPSAVGLYFLGHPVISLIYEHGNFRASDALNSALALQFYAMGLVAYSCIKVLSPAFYAIDHKWTPMFVSFGAIGLNVVLNWLFIFHFGLGHRGLALSTAIAATLNFAALYFLMLRPAGSLDSRRFVGTLVRCGLAAAALGATCWAGKTFGSHWLFSDRFWIKVIALFTLIGVAGLVYVVVCFVLRVEEVREALQIASGKILRRLRKKS